MLDTSELIDRACQRLNCTADDFRRNHRQLVLGEIAVGLHWSDSPGSHGVEVLVDMGPIDSPLREAFLESFLCANLAFYPEGRNMLALDPDSRHVIFATRILIGEQTTDMDVAREIDAAAATGAEVRKEVAELPRRLQRQKVEQVSL